MSKPVIAVADGAFADHAGIERDFGDGAELRWADLSGPGAVRESTSGADAVVICTEWNEFKQLNLGRLKQSMRQPIIVDGRNIYDPKAAERAGFHYRGMGRGYNSNGART